jgi:hypothetical protein
MFAIHPRRGSPDAEGRRFRPISQRIAAGAVFAALTLTPACAEQVAGPPGSPTNDSGAIKTLVDKSPDGAKVLRTITSGLTAESYTFSPEYIEVDRLDPTSTDDFGDANLFAFTGTDAELAACQTPDGADPADGSCDARLPTSALSVCTGEPSDPPDCQVLHWADWNELLTDAAGNPDEGALAAHRILDAVKSDPSSFKNDSCVTNTQVLGKMDITAAAVSNNTEYAYFGLKRYDNNGDAGYAWVFTADAPTFDDTLCDGAVLSYDLTQGDVLIVGNFNPSRGADLMVRRATAAADGLNVIAADVVDPLGETDAGDPIWEELPDASNLASVNTTWTDPGALESIDGVDQTQARTDKGAFEDGAVGPHIFAEAAVDFRLFTGEGDLCGRSFYGTVITQPSSSKTSDLKDLLGPQLFNFGSLNVEGSLAPTCDKEFTYAVTNITAQGAGDAFDYDCHWTFTHDSGATLESSECEGVFTLGPDDPTGTWSGSVDVTLLTGVGCQATDDAGTVDVFDTLSVTAEAAPTCGLGFTYGGTIDGGSGDYIADWSFSGPGETTAADGQATVSDDGTYVATYSVRDARTDIACTDQASASAEVDFPLDIAPTLTPTCELDFGFAVDVTGGTGNHALDWTFTGPGSVDPATSSAASGSASVTADGTYTADLRVSEFRGDLECEANSTLTVDAFAPLEATVNLAETCSLAFEYEGTAEGGSDSVTPTWTFTGPGQTSASASGDYSGTVTTTAQGTYFGTLNLTDNRTDITCTTSATDAAPVYTPLSASADLAPTCDLVFTHSGSVSGGSPATTTAWAFTGPGAASPATTPSLDGSVAVSSPGIYHGLLTATDVRPDGLTCTASAADNVGAWQALGVDVTLIPNCESGFSYAAETTGGSPDGVAYSWSFGGPGPVTASSLDTASGSATVDPAGYEYSGQVLVLDQRADGVTCTARDGDACTPFAPLAVNISPDATSKSCADEPPDLTDGLRYTATASGGDGQYSFTWFGCAPDTEGCAVDPSDTDLCAEASVFATVDDASVFNDTATTETETYRKVTIITSTDH